MEMYKALLVVIAFFPLAIQAQANRPGDFSPMTGQPAADVVGSHDLWGNPTFIGGITNKGPDSQSVW